MRGAALVIVLAFIVMVTGLVVAFFSRAIDEQQISNSSASQTQAELFAQGALSQILGALKQEIVVSSSAIAVTDGTIYAPTSPANAVPALVGSTGTGGLENLLKISSSTSGFYSGANVLLSSSASTTGTSLNGRSISVTRWNKPLLLAKAVPGSTSLTPVGAFTAPCWVLAARNGSNPTAWSNDLRRSASGTTAVMGRYAYAIYDEGGLLDMNVAGYPSAAASTTSGSAELARKGALAFADLTQLPITSGTLSQTAVDRIIAWRNAATGDSNYTAAVRSNITGFLRVSGTGTGSGIVTDRAFPSRQALMKFITSGTLGLTAANAQNLLQYLGTFSRDLNQPSYVPDPARPPIVSGPGTYSNPSDYRGGNDAFGGDAMSLVTGTGDARINPSFLSVRVSGTFTRMDGSLAVTGEPLVKKRFPLNYLAWVTYKGPSGEARNLNATSLTGPDADIAALKNSGFAQSFLASGTAQKVFDAFGLSRVTDNGVEKWVYNHSGTIPLTTVGTATTIKTLLQVAAAGREPDFVELLKAAICAGSKGKSACASYGSASGAGWWQHKIDTLLDRQIIQIAANIIDQFDADGYPTLIYFNNTGTPPTAPTVAGVENLPYILGTRMIVRRMVAPSVSGTVPIPPPATITGTGTGAAFYQPEVWNPHDQNSSMGEPRPTAFRIYAKTADPDNNATWTLYTKGVCALTGTDITGPLSPSVALTAANTEILFSVPNAALFRESVLMGLIDSTTGNSLPTGTAMQTGSSHLIRGTGLLGATTPTGYLQDYSITLSGAPSGWVGFLLGTFPLAWSGTSAITTSGTTYPIGTIYPATGGAFTNSNNSFTVCLDCQDSSGGWANYDTKYDGMGISSFVGFNYNSSGIYSHVTDPRTSRFWFRGGAGWPGSIYPSSVSATSPPIIFRTPRWDQNAGRTANIGLPFSGMAGSANQIGWFGGPWTATAPSNFLYTGLHSENDPSKANGDNGQAQYYTDADGVPRRAMGAYVTSGTTGLPMATASSYTTGGVSTASSQSQSRPIILNRPFRNVSELGYVFSDTPWKNLDFTCPESGDSALLDVFCVNEDATPDGLVAGKVNLNTRQKPVLKAILMGAYKDEQAAFAPLTGTEADNIAAKLIARTQANPLRWKNELVGRLIDPTNKIYDGFSADLTSGAFGDTSSPKISRLRDSTLRALSDCGTTRVWNLMIDVIAQTGRYPQSATGLDNFLVEGEKRYWVHIAIDRMTGNVLETQIEPVTE